MKGNAIEALHDPSTEVCIIPECLLESLPDMSIPNEISLNVFYSGLDMKTALELDVASGGWFAHATLAKRHPR